jgi:Ca-activated chloride channel family protein
MFVHPDRVHLVWLALLICATLIWLELRNVGTLSRFVSRTMQGRLATRQTLTRRIVSPGFVGLAMVLGVFALMRPQTRGETETITSRKAAADIVVLLDVSKSMLAEDAAPTRLARAKAEVTEMLGTLGGHRVGLVAFAGRAAVVCPLTPDYSFFKMALRAAEPHSIGRGGTRIGDGIRKAIRTFRAGEGAKLILLITDGEDHDSYPKDAAKEAVEAGISIVSIGFGSEEGSEIAITDPETGAKTPLKDSQGNIVRSKLDGELLREIALTTEGAYIPAGVAALDLESIVKGHIKPMVEEASAPSVRVVPAEQYPWFALASLVALFFAVWIASTGGRRRAA